MARCRYTSHGLWSVNPRSRQREGEFVRYQKNGTTCLVKWDGAKAESQYHKDYIEIIAEPAICEIDLTNAPVLREILGIAPNTLHPVWDR